MMTLDLRALRRMPLLPGRVRREADGRKHVEELDTATLEKLERLLAPATRGDPESPLRWTPKGQPEKVLVYDFVDPELGKVNPYGVYDIGQDQGWVNVGTEPTK